MYSLVTIVIRIALFFCAITGGGGGKKAMHQKKKVSYRF